jgi:hypothetical protein
MSSQLSLQNYYISLKNLTPWRVYGPGSSVLQADAMTNAPGRQFIFI